MLLIITGVIGYTINVGTRNRVEDGSSKETGK